MLFKNSHKLKNETYVFINEYTGYSISNSNVLYHFNKLKTRTGFNNFTIHGLRHTHATILLNEGQNVKEIAKRLGNTVDMIYKIYGHVLKELEEQSVTLFSQSLLASRANFGANN
ncbi:tyrosine-type recombinase/integrase [Lysinibacillus sp. FJAT-14745]|uniref:tyrosine-type recombinase/integrase n=1 Tax=Lysinibacillus sp. FJAT-14745 TaxID=1704289 RepID=UPI0009E9468E|nr:tyrosine-type recombinase/integrase [Lysinibacillus sp. FJAT-14745]